MKNSNYTCHALYLRHVPYLRNIIVCDNDFRYTCEKWWYFCMFFCHFFYNWVVSGVKGQKITQNDKIFCLLHFMSQEPYISLLLIMHLCKMMMYPGLLLVFSKFWFSRGQKMVKSEKKFSLLHTISQEAHIRWLWF